MNRLLQDLRFLRVVMVLVTITLVILSRFSSQEVAYSGWAMIPTLIAPALVPILFFVILLDVLMAWVFRIDAQADDRGRLGRVIVIDLLQVVVLVASWSGYFMRLAE